MDAGPPGTLSLRPSPPSALAVDRSGLGYLLFNNDVAGNVFHVDTTTGACAPSAASVSLPNKVFINGMAFVANAGSTREALFALVDTGGAVDAELASIDPGTFSLKYIAPSQMNGFSSAGATQVMGGGAGQLFQNGGAALGSTAICRVDLVSGVNQTTLIVPFGQDHLPISAAALWGGDFYFFDSDQSPTDTAVLRFCPADGSVTRVAHWPTQMLLAAVQTTAPSQ